MSEIIHSASNYANSVVTNIKSYVDHLATRITDIENRIYVTETYYGEVFFTNYRGNSWGQIWADSNTNSFLDHLVAGQAYNYDGWYDSGNDTTYPSGTYAGRSYGKYPTALPAPGSSATLIVDQYSDGSGMNCDVYSLVKNGDGSWSAYPTKYNTIRSYMSFS